MQPMKNYREVLKDRTRCILYQASPSSENCAGWIGGRAPGFFDDKADLIQKDDRIYYFYLTLVNPFDPQKMISVFIPTEYEDYLEKNMYPDCSIKVVEHPVTSESAKDIYTHPGLLKHSISGGEIVEDPKSMDQSFLIKLGGNPRLIQDEDYYFSKLEEDSFSFLFQVDEDGYPDNLIKEDHSYPFGFGALYVFAKIMPDELQNPIAGFWQFS